MGRGRVGEVPGRLTHGWHSTQVAVFLVDTGDVMSPELSRETRTRLCALTSMLSSYQVKPCQLLKALSTFPRPSQPSPVPPRKVTLAPEQVLEAPLRGGDLREGGNVVCPEVQLKFPGAAEGLWTILGPAPHPTKVRLVLPHCRVQGVSPPPADPSHILSPTAHLRVLLARVLPVSPCRHSPSRTLFSLVADPHSLSGAEGHRPGAPGGEGMAGLGLLPVPVLTVRQGTGQLESSAARLCPRVS